MTSSITDNYGAEAAHLLNRYERIIEISQEFTSTFETPILLRRIVNAAAEVTESEAASILLLDSVTGELRFEMASNIDTYDFERLVVPLEGSLAGWVVSHGEPINIPDVRNEPRFFKDVDEATEFRTRNILAVPLRSHRGHVIGALEALNKRAGQSHDQDDVRLLNMLALHAAISIENSRLFQQSDFMSEMVHELRTPLVALKTSVALLNRDALPQTKREEIMSTMHQEIERLIKLASEYLDLARLESGRARLEMADTGINGLIQECLDIIRQQAADRQIAILWEPSVDFVVRADRGKIKQVLLNLLTNAIKYNRVGGNLSVALSPKIENSTSLVQIAVADNGLGISRENQRNMFQRFYRVADTAGYAQGTGLGLAIARYIVEGHGGTIWLESEEGHGSTFYFTLLAVS